MREVTTEFMKVGLCPVCGKEIMDSETGVVYEDYKEKELTLSDESVMQQPFCEKDLLGLNMETLDWVWKCIKMQWEKEIRENRKYTEEERERELQRVINLRIIL